MVRPTLRAATAADLPLLWEVLYEAIFVLPGQPAPPRSILRDPHVRQYLTDFPTHPGDGGLVAEIPAGPLGAAWHRQMPASHPGYGFVRPDGPEVTIALLPPYRGQGIGTRLLQQLLEDAEAAGYPGLSLSVHAKNPARRLYQRLGFVRVASRLPSDDAWTMWRAFGDGAPHE